MRKLNYRNKDTKEVTALYEVAKEWKNKEVFFTEEKPPKGQEERELEEFAKEHNKGKIGLFVNGVTHR